ncbi:MAG: CHAT domain-containing protein [Spirulina sp. SIO3F2]|nr:CHAT domain-containing protein [Spirulina sp. SIO3F2]
MARSTITQWLGGFGIIALLNGTATPSLAQANLETGTILQLERQDSGEMGGELSMADPIDDNRHYDIFTLKGEVGAQYTFRVQSQDIDPVIIVIDSAGNTQAYDDSSPELTIGDEGDLVLREGPAYDLPNADASGRVIHPEAEQLEADVFVGLPGFGEYRVVITTFPPRQTGRYTLTWEPVTAANTISVVDDNPETNRIAWGGFLMAQADELRTAGLYGAALPLAEESLHITQGGRLARELGDNNPTFARHFTQLADIYSKLGRYEEAELLYEKSLHIWRTFFGAEQGDNISAAKVLAKQGALLFTLGKYDQAEQASQAALQIFKKLGEPQNGFAAAELSNLAAIYSAQGRHAEAEPLLQESLVLNQQLISGEHPRIAMTLSNLADVYAGQRQFSKAAPLYVEAIAMQRRLYRAEHPDIAQSLNKLARFHWQQNQIDAAIAQLTAALNIEESNLNRLLVLGSERQKRDYFETIAPSTDIALSLHLQAAPKNFDAARLAFTTVLRRKGRILDAVSDNIRAIQQDLNSESQVLLEQLRTTRRQIATLVFDPPSDPAPDYSTEISRLKGKADQLEAQLAQLHQTDANQTQSVTIAQVQAQIPEDAALIEYVLYRPFEPQSVINRWAEPRYAVYILTAQGESQWLDLGPASAIDRQIRRFNRRVQSTNDNPYRIFPIAQDLHQAVIAPVLTQLGGSVQHLLLSPDSRLNLVPFAALVDANEQYLIQNYQITYLTSGRDLLQDRSTTSQRENPLILADINYDEPGAGAASALISTNRRSGDALTRVAALANTAAEGQKIQQLFPAAMLLTQDDATENAIKQTPNPEILHIATHGFFLNIPQIAPTDLSRQFFSAQVQRERPAPSNRENPLLRSGLALAGFNQRRSGSEDGVLTALEVASLDLYGTKLTVLSACETGLGEIANGEGVYGLRRALVIAGSESQVMSLWQVDDAATQQLMVDYYTKLKAGIGRSEALRQVQLELIASENYRTPYYWAAFIPSGNWRSL